VRTNLCSEPWWVSCWAAAAWGVLSWVTWKGCPVLFPASLFILGRVRVPHIQPRRAAQSGVSNLRKTKDIYFLFFFRYSTLLFLSYRFIRAYAFMQSCFITGVLFSDVLLLFCFEWEWFYFGGSCVMLIWKNIVGKRIKRRRTFVRILCCNTIVLLCEKEK
jgi:hypothetical protein